MARRKSAVAEPPIDTSADSTISTIVEPAEPVDVFVEPDKDPNKNEALEKFLARLKGMASFNGDLVWVDCDLPGYEGVRVAYNVDNEFAIAQLLKMQPSGLTLLDHYKLWSLFIRRIEWPFDIPVPSPVEPESYGVLVEQFRSLMSWILDKGYIKAKTTRWGN